MNKRVGLIGMAAIIGIVLVGCGAKEQQASAGPTASTVAASSTVSYDCMSGVIIDYIDFLKFNDIMFYSEPMDGDKVDVDALTGAPVGEVGFTMQTQACPGHQPANGDAAFLPIGTIIYEMKGYKPYFRLIAGGRIYQSNDNPNAKNVQDVLDIAGKVGSITEESTEDGSFIREVDPAKAEAFVNQVLMLDYVDPATLALGGNEDVKFFRIHLTDGTSYRFVFARKSLAFNFGAVGNEEIKSLLADE
ncbi:hypothetical protein [Cohnella yongneupensis]|uniref:Lipoprotein n=1 Tax=Cohnella yongneupensis TaxID=425006 RepID=A0ABW0QYJ3_9BACL